MAADGNNDAAALYSEHSGSLRRYVLRRVPGADDSRADDVVQETFAHTVAHLRNGKKVKSPKGFLFTTARNLIVSMFYRSRHHTETDATQDMDEFATDANTCSPERRAMLHQKIDAFSAAIQVIPKNYQEAFIRRRVWGESCREIAASMGVKEHTVATYVALGWQALNDYCDAHGIVLNDFSDSE